MMKRHDKKQLVEGLFLSEFHIKQFIIKSTYEDYSIIFFVSCH